MVFPRVILSSHKFTRITHSRFLLTRSSRDRSFNFEPSEGWVKSNGLKRVINVLGCYPFYGSDPVVGGGVGGGGDSLSVVAPTVCVWGGVTLVLQFLVLFLVRQSFGWGRDSWLHYFNCILAVVYVSSSILTACASSSRCHRLVCTFIIQSLNVKGWKLLELDITQTRHPKVLRTDGLEWTHY